MTERTEYIKKINKEMAEFLGYSLQTVGYWDYNKGDEYDETEFQREMGPEFFKFFGIDQVGHFYFDREFIKDYLKSKDNIPSGRLEPTFMKYEDWRPHESWEDLMRVIERLIDGRSQTGRPGISNLFSYLEGFSPGMPMTDHRDVYEATSQMMRHDELHQRSQALMDEAIPQSPPDPLKLCFIDLETTGLDPKKNGVIQIAGEVCFLNGDQLETKESFDFRPRPMPGDEIDSKALETTGLTIEEVMGYKDTALAVYTKLVKMLQRYVSKYDKRDKFYFIAYNARFDMDFLREWFNKCDDKYFGSWFWFPYIDVMGLAMDQLWTKRKEMSNFQLGTVADHLGIQVDKDKLHDADVDIKLTKEIFNYIKGIK